MVNDHGVISKALGQPSAAVLWCLLVSGHDVNVFAETDNPVQRGTVTGRFGIRTQPVLQYIAEANRLAGFIFYTRVRTVRVHRFKYTPGNLLFYMPDVADMPYW